MKCFVVCLLVALCGCASTTDAGPYASAAAERRDTSAAEALNREAAERLQSEPVAAEALLREALTRDLFFGPAHNNLGVLHLSRGELYEAASEFECPHAAAVAIRSILRAAARP